MLDDIHNDANSRMDQAIKHTQIELNKIRTGRANPEAFNGIMVSTSANISGQDNLNNIDEIMNVFNESDVAYFDDKLGDNNKPSRIIDLHTRAVIRD